MDFLRNHLIINAPLSVDHFKSSFLGGCNSNFKAIFIKTRVQCLQFDTPEFAQFTDVLGHAQWYFGMKLVKKFQQVISTIYQ